MKFSGNYDLQQLISKQHNTLFQIITGIRRCGKSHLLFTIFVRYLKNSSVPDDHIITLALDDRRNKAS